MVDDGKNERYLVRLDCVIFPTATVFVAVTIVTAAILQFKIYVDQGCLGVMVVLCNTVSISTTRAGLFFMW